MQIYDSSLKDNPVVLLWDLWMEYLNMERIHYEFQESIRLWLQAKLESHSTPCSLSVQLDFTDPLLGESHEHRPL